MKIKLQDLTLDTPIWRMYTNNVPHRVGDYRKEDIIEITINRSRGNVIIRFEDNHCVYLHKRGDFYYTRSDYGRYEREDFAFSEESATRKSNHYKRVLESEQRRIDIRQKCHEELLNSSEQYNDDVGKSILLKTINGWCEDTIVGIDCGYKKGQIYYETKNYNHKCRIDKKGITWKWWGEVEQLEAEIDNLRLREKQLQEKIKKLSDK